MGGASAPPAGHCRPAARCLEVRLTCTRLRNGYGNTGLWAFMSTKRCVHVPTQHRCSSCVLGSGTGPTTYMALVAEMPASDPAGHTPLLRCAEFVHVCEDCVSDSCVSASVTSAGHLSTHSAALVWLSEPRLKCLTS